MTWAALDIYERCMFFVLLLMAAMSNLSIAATTAGIIMGSLIMSVRFLRTRNLPHVEWGMIGVMVVSTLLLAVVCFFSLEPLRSLAELWSSTYRMLPLFFALMFIKAKWQLRWIFLAFAVSVFVDDTKALWQYLTFQDFIGGHRPIGFNRWPTHLASHMLMAMPILFFAAGREYFSSAERKFLVATAVFSFFILIISGTRGAWIAFLGATVVYAVCDPSYRKRAFVAAFSFVGVLCLFGIFVPTVQTRLQTLSDVNFQSNSERLLMWQSALEIIRDYPMTGVGLDEFGYVYNAKYISAFAKERPYDPNNPRTGHGHPHNNLFLVGAEGGLLGLSAFILLHGYFLRQFVRIWRRDRQVFSYGMMAILFFVAVHLEGMTEVNIKQVSIMREYWLLIGVILAASKIKDCP